MYSYYDPLVMLRTYIACGGKHPRKHTWLHVHQSEQFETKSTFFVSNTRTCTQHSKNASTDSCIIAVVSPLIAAVKHWFASFLKCINGCHWLAHHFTALAPRRREVGQTLFDPNVNQKWCSRLTDFCTCFVFLCTKTFSTCLIGRKVHEKRVHTVKLFVSKFSHRKDAFWRSLRRLKILVGRHTWYAEFQERCVGLTNQGASKEGHSNWSNTLHLLSIATARLDC